MKNLSIILACLLAAMMSCTKSKEVHPEIGDGNDEIVTVGKNDVHVKYARTDHAELSRVVFHYCPADANGNAQQFAAAEMTRKETFFELTLNDLLSDTLYWYYYELFPNGGTSTNTSPKTFRTQVYDTPEPPTPPTPPSGAPEGAINGLFTINENGGQVYFSQGNLQYQASTNTWRFAENQYSFVGGVDYQTGVDCGNVYENGVKCDNSLLSSSYDGWIDLFGWGTSGYNHGANCYEPWSTSQYGSDYFAYGIATCNLYDQTGQADWGYNAISNGGNTTGQWRTLTADEWFYVINSRTTTSGIRYAKAKVDEVRGVILLPDNWSTNIYSLNSTNIVSASYTSNIISALQWETLEVAGALFLPVGGYRVNDLVEWIDVGGYGTYWTSTCYNNNHACGLFFTDNSLCTQTYNYAGRIDGQLVRLVQDAN